MKDLSVCERFLEHIRRNAFYGVREEWSLQSEQKRDYIIFSNDVVNLVDLAIYYWMLTFGGRFLKI